MVLSCFFGHVPWKYTEVHTHKKQQQHGITMADQGSSQKTMVRLRHILKKTSNSLISHL